MLVELGLGLDVHDAVAAVGQATTVYAVATALLSPLVLGAARAFPPYEVASACFSSGALWWGDATLARAHAQALAQRQGPILPLITDAPDMAHAMMERHICIDTTASGGNAQLLAEVSA